MAEKRSRKLFVNLPVRDLKRSVAFFTRLGFSFNPQFTDEHATCMLVGEDAYVMLLTEERFKGFTSKQICDTSKHTEGLFALSAESRAEVDSLVKIAVEHGGSPASPPQDHGFMYGWSFQDPDGHTWEVVWMDPVALTQPMTGHALEVIAPADAPEIITRSVVNAPRSLVYEAFTKPELLQRWQGPRRLTCTLFEQDLREGGDYRFVMRAPDGQEYRFRGTFREIVPEERIVRTFVFEPMADHPAVETLLLEDVGGKTKITTRTVHQTMAGRDGHLGGGRMEAGMKESYTRLEELLAELRGGKA
jgi:predicted lactoylglutathione lyase/uncharacterized protein YndB with AHSA1/START domain